jgi:hypothetical protein
VPIGVSPFSAVLDSQLTCARDRRRGLPRGLDPKATNPHHHCSRPPVPLNHPGVLHVEPSFGTLFCLYFKYGNREFLQAPLRAWCPLRTMLRVRASRRPKSRGLTPAAWIASDPKSSRIGGFGCQHLLSRFWGDSSTCCKCGYVLRCPVPRVQGFSGGDCVRLITLEIEFAV